MGNYNLLDKNGFFVGNICEECFVNHKFDEGLKVQEIDWTITCQICGNRVELS